MGFLQVINIMICTPVLDRRQRLLQSIQITSNTIRTSHYYVLKETEKPDSPKWKLQMDSFVLAKINNEKLPIFCPLATFVFCGTNSDYN